MNMGEIRKHIISREPVLVRVVDGGHIYYMKCDYIYGICFHGKKHGHKKTKIYIGVECAMGTMLSGEPRSVYATHPKNVFPCPVDEEETEEDGE